MCRNSLMHLLSRMRRIMSNEICTRYNFITNRPDLGVTIVESPSTVELANAWLYLSWFCYSLYAACNVCFDSVLLLCLLVLDIGYLYCPWFIGTVWYLARCIIYLFFLWSAFVANKVQYISNDSPSTFCCNHRGHLVLLPRAMDYGHRRFTIPTRAPNHLGPLIVVYLL